MEILKDKRVSKKIQRVLGYSKEDKVGGHFRLHDLIEDLTESLKLTPEQQFRVTAKIKRYIHDEKAGVYFRSWLDLKWGRSRSYKKFLREKYLSHRELAVMPDEKIVTWSIGSHVFKQAKPKCTKCGNECVTGYSYSCDETGRSIYLCLNCKPVKEGEF